MFFDAVARICQQFATHSADGAYTHQMDE